MKQVLACELAAMDDKQRARYRVVVEQVESSALSTQPVPGGVAIRYTADPDTILRLAEFVTLERLCCPFFDFDIRLGAGATEVELQITGGPGVQEFLQAEIQSRR